MSIFSTVWVDGRIDSAEDFLMVNKDLNFMFVIDTNFAIMAREYVTNSEKFDKDYAIQKIDFLMAIKIIKQYSSRIIYAYACEEAARSKDDGKIDKGKYALMVDCIGEIFDRKFDNHLLSKNEVITEGIKDTKIPLLKKNGLFKDQSIILYATILKVYLIKQFDPKENKIKVKEMLNFVAEEINVFSAASTSLIIHYLGYETTILKGIKRSLGFEEILNRIYAATIDLMLPTKATQLAEISEFEEIPIFVTFDKGIKLLFDSLFIMDIGYLNNGVPVPIYSTRIYNSSGWNNKDIKELCNYAQQVQRGPRKDLLDRGKEQRRLLKLIHKLEQELKNQLNNS